MKTLYVTDLDGTLFNRDKRVTFFSADIINQLIAQGGLFTIATARMPYGCDEKLSKLNLNIPGIVMNGACLYSFSEKKYISVRNMAPDVVLQIQKLLDAYACNVFMYTYNEHALSIFYKTEEEDGQYSQYLSKRAHDACREIVKVKTLYQTAPDRQYVYFALTGHKDLIQQIKNETDQIPGVASSMYLNIYNGLYCLEIFDMQANKANALAQMKEMTGAEQTVVFGDNHNDISMMRAADRSYAVANAVDEAKAAADGIIGSCTENGVAKFLMKEFELCSQYQEQH